MIVVRGPISHCWFNALVSGGHAAVECELLTIGIRHGQHERFAMVLRKGISGIEESVAVAV
jgi:hypothetical protein